jgi:ribosomal protein S18 acetylase RimI-like enzyme
MKPNRHPSLIVGPARPDEREAAFRLIFQHFGTDLLSNRIGNAMEMVRQGEMDPSGVLVARDRRGLVGAMVSVPVPGASGLVWPPQTRDLPDQSVIEDQLIQATACWLRGQGAKMAQALLTADEQALAHSLERNGFDHITSLWYLRHDLSPSAASLLATDHLTYRTYREVDRALFHQILLRSYEYTVDCPEVNGVRTIDEIIAGHVAQGRHDPDRWWLALHKGQPVGVMLVVELVESRAWDIAYVGVVPEARRRGHGRELTRKAIEAARAADAGQLTLAVDNRNRAAWNLYRQFGFEPYDQREVYLAVWKQAV